MHRVTASIVWVLALAWAAGVLGGCTSSEEGTPKANQPPVVWLASAPPEGSTERYTIQMYWGGWDPDGEIAYYEYTITDNDSGPFEPADTSAAPGFNPWRRVVANDSTFTFTADVLTDPLTNELVTEFKRSHTFFIRAVDTEGLASPEPAYRSFTARTLSPEVTITVPRPVSYGVPEVPSISTYRWTARDFVDDRLTSQDPDSVQWVLVPTDNYNATIGWLRQNGPEARAKWGPWVSYNAPEDSGKAYTTTPLDLGAYVFAVRAKDEAGAVTPVLDPRFNVRSVRVSKRLTGPFLALYNQYLGPVSTTICTSPVAIMDLPAGVPLEFCWQASADAYGGLVAGYRYGWDITDLDDPDDWEVDYTPFSSTIVCSPPRTFYFGSHTFTVEVVDNSGFCSRQEVKVNIVQFTLQKNLILFDDFSPDKRTGSGWNGTGKGIIPNDSEHDAFWADMLSGVEGFDPLGDVLEVKQGTRVPLARVMDYKSIVWNVYGEKQASGDLPKLYEFIRFQRKSAGTTAGAGKVEPNLLALFMAAGGHVFISGNHPMSNVLNRGITTSGVRYPLIYQYELAGDQPEDEPDINNPVGDRSFAYFDMCVDVIDYSFLEFFTRRKEGIYCDVEELRQLRGNSLKDDTMRGAIPLDPAFPHLSLRPEAAGPGKAYELSKRGVDTEIFNPDYFLSYCDWAPKSPRGCFKAIYGLECIDTAEPTYAAPVAFWTYRYADRVAEVAGAVGAPSVMFGFPPVFFKPEEVKPGIEYILFDVWKLPRAVR